MKNAIETLRTELDRRQKTNPRYSMRAFARQLQISPAQLSQMLTGKRPFTASVATRLANRLDLSPAERREFLASAVLSPWSKDKEPHWAHLEEDRFQLIADWKHFAVLSLTKVRGARGDGGWIATQLGLSYSEACEILARLRRMQLISEDPEDFRQLGEPIQAISEVPSPAIRRFHREALELSLKKLEDTPVERRDFSSVFFPMREADMNRFREMIMTFQDQLIREAERSPGSDVFAFSCQLFPVTKGVSS